MIAALYVEPTGVYSGLDQVDPWSEARDARRYDGPWPVVAHPPCARWSRLRGMATQDTADCGPRAVEQVRIWHGVLEHPAFSTLWAHCGLPDPGAGPDSYGGYTLHVEQSRWGHRAPKPTWLYIVGCARSDLPRIPDPVEDPGGRVNEMSKDERSATPVALALWLREVAHRCAATLPPGGSHDLGCIQSASAGAPCFASCHMARTL